MRNLHLLIITLGVLISSPSLVLGLEANANPSNSPSVRSSALQWNSSSSVTNALPRWQKANSATVASPSSSKQAILEVPHSVNFEGNKLEPDASSQNVELKKNKELSEATVKQKKQSLRELVPGATRESEEAFVEPLITETVKALSEVPDERLEGENKHNSALSAASVPTPAAKRQINADLGIVEVNSDVLTAQSSEVVGDTFSPEEVDAVRESLLVEPLVSNQSVFIPLPASNFGTPSGFGASWGSAFTGVSYASASSTSDDGSAVLGIGFGDSLDSVGFELDVELWDVSGLGDDGTLGFKIHKAFSTRTAVSVGWSSLVKWGFAEELEDTFFGAVSHRFDLKPNNVDNNLPLTITVGVGTGTYRSIGAIDAGENTPNVFASAGLRVIPQLSLVSTWTGNHLNLGVSATPFKLPFVITVGVADVTSNFDEGAKFSLSAGYAFNFF